jgi:prolipoprotein diacylglyceryltransferase
MKTSTKVLYWLPRILVILAILFVSLFALDSFSSVRTFWQNAADFLMNLIPAFVLLVILIIAWKWEKTGGIILTIFGLAFCIIVFIINYRRTHSVEASLLIVLAICVPFVLGGILFIISHYRKKNLPLKKE